MTNNTGVQTAILAAVAVVAAACGAGLPPLRAEEYASALKTLADLQSVDMVTRHDCTAHETYIRAAAWQRLDAVAKRGVTIDLAVACATVGQTDTATMTVYDSQSAQRLAYVGALGYRIE